MRFQFCHVSVTKRKHHFLFAGYDNGPSGLGQAGSQVLLIETIPDQINDTWLSQSISVFEQTSGDYSVGQTIPEFT